MVFAFGLVVGLPLVRLAWVTQHELRDSGRGRGAGRSEETETTVTESQLSA